MKAVFYLVIVLFLFCCGERSKQKMAPRGISLVVLGNLQDGGSPHIGCNKKCCLSLFEKPDPERMVVSLGITDNTEERYWLFDASPDISRQLQNLSVSAGSETISGLGGVFLSHAHIGHYSGLMYLGREALGAKEIPVYAMPRMQKFLSENGPWSQLVSSKNIVLKELRAGQRTQLSEQLFITPLLVPHRDEFSETAGFLIQGPNKKALYIPDIDKWNKWDKDIKEEIKKVDYAFIDGTFFSADEINNRDISEIPHPFVSESLELFRDLQAKEKRKIFFIHFNHSNPLLDPNSAASKKIESDGMGVARKGMKFQL
jgi:pyrroloquinoline quinone biosynthesis protein B